MSLPFLRPSLCRFQWFPRLFPLLPEKCQFQATPKLHRFSYSSSDPICRITNFQQQVDKYRNDADTQSPLWIWFQKIRGSLETRCKICESWISTGPRNSTSNLIQHLRGRHGYRSTDYNAFEIYLDLCFWKNQNESKRKAGKQKNSVNLSLLKGQYSSCHSE